MEFDFINLGISGNQTKDLVERLQSDFIDIDPDIVSILIGVNDVWHHAGARDWIPNEIFTERYETVLKALKEKTHAKIIIMEPFLTPAQDKEYFREDLDPKIQIVRKLAYKYADVFIPLEGLLAAETLTTPPSEISGDGVHPGAKGPDIVGRIYCEYASKLIDELK